MPTVGLVGVGLIGRAWANVFARAGWDVKAWDADPAITAAAPKLVGESLHDLARHGLVKEPDKAAARVRSAASLEECVSGVDFVQESGPERVDDKIAMWAKLDAAAPRHIVLASSTSGIVASHFTEKLEGRARCLVAHPVNPPHVVPIVELCGAPWTSADTVAKARAIFDSVGQVPVEVKKEIDGFILNRLQAVLLSEAFRLVQEGYCSASDLDKTIAHGLGLRWSFMGPFETIELNAPGGTLDYCGRYGELLLKLSSRPVTPEVWARDNIARAAATAGEPLSGSEITAKSRWRDERLAALLAHKRAQTSFKS